MRPWSRHPLRSIRHPERSEGSPKPQAIAILVAFLSAATPDLRAEQSMAGVPVSPAQALAAFDLGDYAGAARQYEELVSSGIQNGHLYYNLGVAYYRAGQIGQSMAAFLAARDLLPRHPDVAANLRFVSERIRNKLDSQMPPEPWQLPLVWVRELSAKEWAYLWAILWAAAMLAACADRLRPGLPGVKIAVRSALSLAMLTAVFFLVHRELVKPWGAVVTPTASMRSGPAESNVVLFELEEGAPFQWEGRSDGWLKIRLSDGKKGWVLQSAVRVLR